MNGYRWKARPRVVHDAQHARSAVAVAPDHRSFGRQLLPYLEGAYRYARYLSKDQSAAEDIVQEAFLRAMKGYASCRGKEKAWLFAIVRNCFIDWAAANRSVPPDYADDPATAGSAVETPETQLQRKFEAVSVRAAIAGLPEPFREAIILRELDALSYREIAAITDVPIGTVMSRLARARLLLATLLLSRDREGIGR